MEAVPGGRTGAQNPEKWGAFDPLPDKWADLIRVIRDQVLTRAALKPGQQVLDVGAGTGLVTLEACRQVGPSGRVVAVDLSHRALDTCCVRAAAAEAGAEVDAVVNAVVSDALYLPFQSGYFDVALVRSVLMYIDDKVAAARELRRVLRPGGLVSVFEPINRHTAPVRWYQAIDLVGLRPEDRQAHADLSARLWDAYCHAEPDRVRGLGFDQHDLVQSFVKAGFTEVQLTYNYVWTSEQHAEVQSAAVYLDKSPYPAMARELLGDAADEYLGHISALPVQQPGRGIVAEAYVVARP